MNRRKEGRAEVPVTTIGKRRANGDEAGKVVVLRSQSIADPRTETGPHECLSPGMQFQSSRYMGVVVAVHGMNHAQFVGAGPDVREKAANGKTALAVSSERPGRLENPAQVSFEPVSSSIDGIGEGLTVSSVELGFLIKRIYVRRSSMHV